MDEKGMDEAVQTSRLTSARVTRASSTRHYFLQIPDERMELTVRWYLHRSSYMRRRIGESLERSLVQHAIQLSKPAIISRL
jgi:hypothetical protein